MEPYVDSEGVTKWAIAYGMKYTELNVWYHLEEVKNFFSNWSMPTRPRWANLQQWRKSAKTEPFRQKTVLDSRDSSRNRTSGDNRGSRGNERGSYNPRSRGSGIGRGGNKEPYPESYSKQEKGFYKEGHDSHPGRDRARKSSYDDDRNSQRRKRSHSYKDRRYRRERSDSRDRRSYYYRSSRSGK